MWLDGFESEAVTFDQPVVAFGRRGDFVLDPRDLQLHRDLGELHLHPIPVLKNVGRLLVLFVRYPNIDRTRIVRLHPQTHMELTLNEVEIWVKGSSPYLVRVEIVGSTAPTQDLQRALGEADTIIAGDRVKLTTREREVLVLMCEHRLRSRGLAGEVPSNRDLAKRLAVAERTIEEFVSSIFAKFVADGVNDLAYDARRPVAARRMRLVELALLLEMVRVDDLPALFSAE